MASRPAGRAEPTGCLSEKKRHGKSGNGNRSLFLPACMSPRSKPRAGERLSVARLPHQPERARADRAVHRRLPGVLGAGAGDGAPARRARAAARARPDAAAPRAPGAGRGGDARRRRQRGRHRARLCARRRGAARLGRRPRRRRLPRHLSAAVASPPAPRCSSSWPGWRSPLLARCCPRSTPRARRRRARSRRATSRRCSRRYFPAWPGLALLAAGAALAQLGPVSGMPLFGYAAIACLLVGSVCWCRGCSLPSPQDLTLPGTPPCPRDRAAARRAGAGGDQPGRDRGELRADGGDGDHGGLVPRARSTAGSTRCCRRSSTSAPRTAATPATSSPGSRRACARCRRSRAPSSCAAAACCSRRAARPSR